MAQNTYIPKQDGSGYYKVVVGTDGALTLTDAPGYLPPSPSPADTTTYGDIVRDALRELGVRASGETLSASEMQDGLRRLRQLMASWNLEPLLSYTEEINSFSTVGGKQTYTLGTDGDWNLPRPVKIDQAFYTLPNSSPEIEYQLIGPVEDEQWGRIGIKSLSLTLPAVIYNRGDYPLTRVSLWPIPQVASTITLHTRNKMPVATATQNAIVVLPEGYELLLVTGLAIHLAPQFGTEPSQTTVANYTLAKANVKRANLPTVTVEQDSITGPTGSGSVNRRAFLSGGYTR